MEKPKMTYLEMQAEMGITKHMGGAKATDELVRLCGIGRGSYVLDVGCGIGLTAARLVKKHGCRVMAVDISPRMVEWAKKNARQEGTYVRTEFRVADAQRLPFPDGTFDAVISESVTAFVKDKGKAVAEYARVAKPCGYVGMNEAIQLKRPSGEFLKEFEELSKAQLITADEWEGMLKKAGLRKISVRRLRTPIFGEIADRLALLGIRRVLGAWIRMFTMLPKPGFRAAIWESVRASKGLRKFEEYMGYALIAGRKPKVKAAVKRPRSR